MYATPLAQQNSVLTNPYTKQTDLRYYQQPLDQKGRFYGIAFLLTQIGVMIGYGLAGSFYIQPTPSYTSFTEVFGVILSAMFVLVGFGMLLSYFRFGAWLGMTTAIMVVALSVQLSPLLQKFWFNVFISSFGNMNLPSNVGNNVLQFWNHYSGNDVQASSFMNRTTFMSCISILVVMTAVVGRLSTTQILKVTAVFQIIWNLNYFLLIFLLVVKQDHSDTAKFTPFFFDAFGSTYVYLFAAFFGIIFTCILRNQKMPWLHPRNQANRTSLIMSATGTAFIFATFVFTQSDVIEYTPYGKNLTRFNIIWGLTGSVIGTYIGSGLAGKGKVGYKQAIVGTITGGVVMGSAAPFIHNIGIVIMIGAVAGFLSGIYMRTIHLRVNKTNVIDLMGLFGPFLISALGGSLVVTPAALAYYFNQGIVNQSFGLLYPLSLAGWQLIYVGISAAIGLGAGLLAGLMCLCDKEYFGLASNSRIFENDFGLYSPQIVTGLTPVPVANNVVYHDVSASNTAINHAVI